MSRASLLSSLLCACAALAACGSAKPTAAAADVVAPKDTVAAADVPVDAGPESCADQPCAGDTWCEPVSHFCQPRVPEAQAASDRLSCTFGKGDTALRTIGQEYPLGAKIPIDHFVLVMMENRSFDHYFGAGKAAGLDVEGPPADASNPDGKGNNIKVFHETQGCIADVHHDWTSVHTQLNGGKMDGFVASNNPGGERAMGYFDGSDLPFYYAVAKAFGIGDHHHCSVPGPTWVNRLYYVSATSFGRTNNAAPPSDVMATHFDDQILGQLSKAGVDWKVYASDLTVFFIFGQFYVDHMDQMKTLDDYFADAKAGTLPSVAFVEPTFSVKGASRNDEHPPGTPWQGQQFAHSVLTALMASPNWPKSAYIQTYDEHGGFYDHVVPPPACEPDDYLPIMTPPDPTAKFNQYGIRVPLLVASPWSKPGYVSHTVSDNTSMIRLVQARFGLGALTHRDANAWPLLDFFDFSKPALLTPPTLPDPQPMAAEIAACIKQFP